ncbi:MAG: MTAP family purine nucleoside phosphorylase [Bacillota bacterium]
MATTLIIGGTAAYHLDFGAHVTLRGERVVQTPFGEAGPVLLFRAGAEECALLSRHGGQGRLGVTPPFIHYQANLWVARELGARRVLSWNSAGSLVRSLEPGCIAAVSDLIDWTKTRRSTFGTALPERPRPTGPLFDPALREGLVRAARGQGHYVGPSAVYAATEGARLETAAEIRLLAAAGAELVGMTMAPEVFLARELGLAYGSLCWVSNYATGVPFDGPERRLFQPEVGQLLFSIILKFLQEEAGSDAP